MTAWVSKLALLDRVKSLDGLMNVQWFGGHVNNTAIQNDAAIAAALAEGALAGGGTRGLYFPKMDGDWHYGTTITNTRSGFVLAGDVGSRLFFEGAGAAILFDGGAVAGSIWNCGIRDLIVRGNALATIGVELRACHNSQIDNVRIRDVTGDGFLSAWGVGNLWNRCRISNNEEAHSFAPSRGMNFTRRGAGENSTANVLVAPFFDGLGGGAAGILADYCDSLTVYGGVAQSCGVGFSATANGGQHEIHGMFFEGNAIEDILCDSFWNLYENCHGNTRLHFGPNSYADTALRGAFLNILIDANVGITDQAIDLDRVAYGGQLGGGGLTDNGRNTRNRAWFWTGGTQIGYRKFTWGPTIAAGDFASHTENNVLQVPMGEISHVTCQNILPDGVEIYATVIAPETIRVTAVNRTGAPVTLQSAGPVDFTFVLNRF